MQVFQPGAQPRECVLDASGNLAGLVSKEASYCHVGDLLADKLPWSWTLRVISPRH
jgi:hypothetical protein